MAGLFQPHHPSPPLRFIPEIMLESLLSPLSFPSPPPVFHRLFPPAPIRRNPFRSHGGLTTSLAIYLHARLKRGMLRIGLGRLGEIWSLSKSNRGRRVADGNLPSSSMLGQHGDGRLLGRLAPFRVDLLRHVDCRRATYWAYTPRLWRRIPNLLRACPQAYRSVLGHWPLRAPGCRGLFAFPRATLAVLTPVSCFLTSDRCAVEVRSRSRNTETHYLDDKRMK